MSRDVLSRRFAALRRGDGGPPARLEPVGCGGAVTKTLIYQEGHLVAPRDVRLLPTAAAARRR